MENPRGKREKSDLVEPPDGDEAQGVTSTEMPLIRGMLVGKGGPSRRSHGFVKVFEVFPVFPSRLLLPLLTLSFHLPEQEPSRTGTVNLPVCFTRTGEQV